MIEFSVGILVIILLAVPLMMVLFLIDLFFEHFKKTSKVIYALFNILWITITVYAIYCFGSDLLHLIKGSN